MAPVSRLELNFCRLLERCESIADDRKSNDWRLEKYLQSLEDMLVELGKINTCQPSKDDLLAYSKKVEFLKDLISKDKAQKGPEKKLNHEQLLLAQAPDNKTSEIKLKRQTRINRDAREELFGSPLRDTASHGEKTLRQRTTAQGSGTGEDFDAVLRYHHSMQEKIAEEMLSLAQNLKQNATLAGHIVKKDTETVQKTVQNADQNYSKLQTEQSRLEEHLRRSCSCWIWMMLGVVCIVFLNMVVFMRVFPKRL
ncbi:vesicle transport protein USE1-like isoform X2 [Ornithodoros turicata]|uniref:vesicle transport protein USE1-like isoform X2 n=1 Tax=Ornithodoros turicata TaxID=34597 RepID=UPI003138870C